MPRKVGRKNFLMLFKLSISCAALFITQAAINVQAMPPCNPVGFRIVHQSTQSSGIGAPVSADFNNDGNRDLVMSSRFNAKGFVSVFRGNGMGSFSPLKNFGEWSEMSGALVRDFNNDGKLDVLSANFSTNLLLFLGGCAMPHIKSDYDGDGTTDVAVFRTNVPNPASWFVPGPDITRGTGTSGSATDMPAPADYDNDGIYDFATFRPAVPRWESNLSSSATGPGGFTFGANGDIPVSGLYVVE